MFEKILLNLVQIGANPFQKYSKDHFLKNDSFCKWDKNRTDLAYFYIQFLHYPFQETDQTLAWYSSKEFSYQMMVTHVRSSIKRVQTTAKNMLDAHLHTSGHF